MDGKRILVDPVFYAASPVSFISRPFEGADLYKPDDMPEIDYLVITHDHWDHLDNRTVKELKDKTHKIICTFGAGEYFEYWGYKKEQLIELDWEENAIEESEFTIYCLPTRHFSGRGLVANQTLWASFLLETPSLSVFVGGDGGYGDHFARIGSRHSGIDWAIYYCPSLQIALSKHPWDEPFRNEKLLGKDSLDIVETIIGKSIGLVR